MKYRVGDRVQIKKGLKVGDKYGAHKFTEEMCKFNNNTVTIIMYLSGKYGYYRVLEDNGESKWSEEMFDIATKCGSCKYSNSDCPNRNPYKCDFYEYRE